MKAGLAVRNTVNASVANDCTSTTITAAAYVTMVASLAGACSAIEVFNTTAKAIKLAIGAAASEADIYTLPPGTKSEIIPREIKKATRISAKALGADATTGFLVVNFLA